MIVLGVWGQIGVDLTAAQRLQLLAFIVSLHCFGDGPTVPTLMTVLLFPQSRLCSVTFTWWHWSNAHRLNTQNNYLPCNLQTHNFGFVFCFVDTFGLWIITVGFFFWGWEWINGSVKCLRSAGASTVTDTTVLPFPGTFFNPPFDCPWHFVTADQRLERAGRCLFCDLIGWRPIMLSLLQRTALEGFCLRDV